MLHKDVASGDIHRMHNWDVADLAERDALVVVAADVGKVARVAADQQFYMLFDHDPVTWNTIGTPGSSSFFNQIGEPDFPTLGARWYNPDDGVTYTYIDNGVSSLWAEV